MYFFISGLSTTNILRLTKGNSLPILSSKCVCDNCGAKINAFMQTPIISYIICKGRCRNCGCKIPVYPLILEIVIFTGMCFIATVTGFSYIGVIFSFVFYEIVRIFMVVVRKPRENGFVKQYIIAVSTMFVYIALLEFAALVYHIA